MSHELADQILEFVAGRAEAEVTVTSGTHALTRFANSFIHQNVAEEGAAVRLRVAVDDKVASGTSTNTERAALQRFVDSTIEAAALQPVDVDWPGLTEPAEVPLVKHFDRATSEADPGARASRVAAFIAAGNDMNAAGFCSTTAHEVAFANTRGHRASGAYTEATLDGIHRTATSAGAGHAASARLQDIDADAVGQVAAQRARDGASPYDVKPGEYEVVLAPECVATIAVFFAAYGFNAKAFIEEQSFVELGAQQFDEGLHIYDDAAAPAAVGLGFDNEGTPKRRVDLVAAGVTSGLTHDRRTAAKMSVEPTGHAIPGSEVYGAFPTNVFIEGGDESAEELISAVERGIYVATFNYCRVLDPKSLGVTGLTRNGTFMIENGEITGAITNMRFTQSFVDALGPGRIRGLGDDARLANSEFGSAMMHVPSMRLAGWQFTGGAEG